MCKMCDSIHILSPGILFVSSLVVGLRIAARLVHCPIYLSVLFALSYQRKKPFYAMIRDEHLFIFSRIFLRICTVSIQRPLPHADRFSPQT